MRRAPAALLLLALAVGCGGPRPEPAPEPPPAPPPAEAPDAEPAPRPEPEPEPEPSPPETPDAIPGLDPAAADAAAAEMASHFLEAWPAARVEAEILARRDFDPEAYWEVLLPLLEAAPERFAVREVASSVQGRPIRRIDFGRGDVSVLLWSQMHGNESTASRSLVDVLRYLRDHPDEPRVRRIEEKLAVTAIPVLNPDGAARFHRYNAVGIDVNRDARELATPEGRALKAVRDDVDARWGFNLHDQNVRTRLGNTGRDVLIALLAPPPGPGQSSPANRRAREMCSLLARALEPLLGDHVGRYDESFNPRAFGDLMTAWGTSVILIESGGELGDPDKARLRTANFVAILTALDAIAGGAWEGHGAEHYLDLPLNAAWVYDVLVRGASIVLPGAEPVRADLAINFGDTLIRDSGRIQEVGDLRDAGALEEIDAAGLYFHPDAAALGRDRQLRPGSIATGVLTRDPAGERVVMHLEAGQVSRPDSTR